MSILRAYRTELDPNRASCLLFLRHAGTARFAYNWGLERLSEAHRAQIKPPSKFYLNRELNRLKRNELAWLYEVSAHAPAEGLRDLHRAYDNFLRNGARLAKRPMAKGRRPRKDGMPKGFPRFKSRKHGVGGFRLRGHIHVFKDAIQLPRIGRIRLKERGYLPTEGVKVLSATVSERAGRWFVSLHVEQVIKAPKNDGPVVGIDLGILRLITVSDGTFISNPRALPKYQRRLKRLQRSAARKMWGVGTRLGLSKELPAVISESPTSAATPSTRRRRCWREPSHALGWKALGCRG